MQFATDRSYAKITTLSSLFLMGCLLLYVIGTWHWPLVGDAAVMHYVVFLMDHGMAPYRDIVDPNLPTTFLIQGAVVHLFGGGPLPWRLFDIFLVGVSGIAMWVICKPYGWFAGAFAGALYALIHGRDGITQLGQRDLTMTAFLLIGYAFLFEELRATPSGKTKLWMTFMFGASCGIAATIKPSVLLLPPTLLVMAALVLKRKGRPFLFNATYGIIGMLVPMTMVFAYVFHRHVLRAFWGSLFDLVPYFGLLDTRSFGHLVLHSVSSVMLPIVLIWIPIVVASREKWLTWERAALFVGALFGLASFYVQRKGYPYHRYPSEAFMLLLIGIDFATVLNETAHDKKPYLHRLALAGILVGVILIGGGSTVHALRQDAHNHEFTSMLEADLKPLGGNKLTGHIQCLDMADSCITALYDMKLVQATGFLYDCYMFSTTEHAERERYREAFWQAITKNPPTVFVVSSHDCQVYPELPSYNYKKMSRWPLFSDYLKANYHLDVERIPPHMVNWGSSPSKPLGYRIYMRNTSSSERLPAVTD
jgi:hypothetical protein